MLGSSGRLGRRIRSRGARLFAWLTLALLMALFVNVPLGLCADAVLDSGFEAGVDGTSLSSVWTYGGSGFSPAAVYDDTDVFAAKVGSLYAHVKGPVAGKYGLLTANAPISADGSSLTFWAYIDAHENHRYFLGSIWGGATEGTNWLRIDSTGNIGAYTSKTGIPGYPKGSYVPIGTLTTGWTQYKITMDFTNDTYTFSTRKNAADAWVGMKAAAAPDYNIPMRGSGDVVSQTTITYRVGSETGVSDVELGLDEVTYDVPTLSAAAGTFEDGSRRRSAAGRLLDTLRHGLRELRVRRLRRLQRQAGLALRLPQGPVRSHDGRSRLRHGHAAFRRLLRDPLLGQHEHPRQLPLLHGRPDRRLAVGHVLAAGRRRRQAFGLDERAGFPERLRHRRLHPDREPVDRLDRVQAHLQLLKRHLHRLDAHRPRRRLGADEGRGGCRLRHPDARHRGQHLAHADHLPPLRGQHRARSRRRALLLDVDPRGPRDMPVTPSTAPGATRQRRPRRRAVLRQLPLAVRGPPRHAVCRSTSRPT